MERMKAMPLGVVIERREIDNPWEQYAWCPIAVIPGAGPVEGWRVLNEGPGWTQYHAATLPLELHRKETEAYRTNLSDEPPVIYVVLRETEEDGAWDFEPFLVTASPFDAQDYLDSGDDIVEGVPMPDGVVAWVQAFVDKHHVDEPFIKRKRKVAREDAHDPFSLEGAPPRRLNGGGGDHG